MSHIRRRNSKSFTLMEVTLAAVLTAILMIAGTASISMMYKAVRDFHSVVQADLNCYDFINQISADMHQASYAEISDNNNTLQLYSYGGDVIATYANFAGGGIQYSINKQPLQPLQRFRGVNATFLEARRDTNTNKIIEIRIDITMPFVSSVYLRHGISARSDSWALMFQNGHFPYVKQTFNSGKIPSGYILIGVISPYLAVLNLDSNGYVQWVTTYNVGGNASALGTPYDHIIKQTFDAGGNPTGYILWSAIPGPPYPNTVLMKLDNNGAIQWVRKYGTSVDYNVPSDVIQVFATNGNPDGYLAISEAITGVSGGSWMYAVRTDDNGNVRWGPYIYGRDLGDWAHCVKETYNASHQPDGFIMAGETNLYNSLYNAYAMYSYLYKIDLSGNHQWSRVFGTLNSSTYASPYWGRLYGVDQTFDTTGQPTGYIACGVRYRLPNAGGNDQGMYILRTNTSGVPVWSKIMCLDPNANIYEGRFIYQLPDRSQGFFFGGEGAPGYWCGYIAKIYDTAATSGDQWIKAYLTYLISPQYGDFSSGCPTLDANGNVTGYIVTGTKFTGSDFVSVLIKTDANGVCHQANNNYRMVTLSAPSAISIGSPPVVSTYTSRQGAAATYDTTPPTVIDPTPPTLGETS